MTRLERNEKIRQENKAKLAEFSKIARKPMATVRMDGKKPL